MSAQASGRRSCPGAQKSSPRAPDGRYGPVGGLAVVLLDGDYEDPAYYLRRCGEARFVVVADGGQRFASAHGVRVDVLVGDFDSLDEAEVAAARRAGAQVRRHPARKDETDGELAVDVAVAERPGELVLAGALGGHLDHVVGHLALLRRAVRRGVPARLASPELCVTALIGPSAADLDAGPGTRVSLVPLEGDASVSLEGVAYPLDRGLLPADACLGLGNAVAGRARVTVHAGAVAVFVHDGEETFGRRGRRSP